MHAWGACVACMPPPRGQNSWHALVKTLPFRMGGNYLNRSEWRINAIPEQKDQNWVSYQNQSRTTNSRCKHVQNRHNVWNTWGLRYWVRWWWQMISGFEVFTWITLKTVGTPRNRHDINVICRGPQLLEYLCISTGWSLFRQWPIPLDFPLEEDPKNPIFPECRRPFSLEKLWKYCRCWRLEIVVVLSGGSRISQMKAPIPKGEVPTYNLEIFSRKAAWKWKKLSW